MKHRKIKLAIADDQRLFREGLKMIIETFDNLELIIEAAGGPALIEEMENQCPDVILLDYTMPEMDGYETMRAVREKFPEVKVIILTMHYDESLMAFMMREGANGYLLKDEEPQNVQRAVEIVFREGVFFPDYVSKALLDALKTQVRQRKPDGAEAKASTFSDREKEVLALIGTKSRRQIADNLYLSVKTIDFHIKNLKEKTNCASTPELVSFAIRNGFQ